MSKLLSKKGHIALGAFILTTSIVPSLARTLQKDRPAHSRPAKRRLTKHQQETLFHSKTVQSLEIPVEKQLPLTVIVYAHNTAASIEKNIDSILKQQYDHYRIIYINDASKDNSQKLLDNYLVSHQLSNKIQLITYDAPQGKLNAFYNAIHHCQDHEIIVLLDGRDWLVNEWVLSNICHLYHENDILLTYGSCTSFPYGCNIGMRNGATPDDIVKKHQFRKVFPFMPLRSFYAWLFKQIKKEDLVDPGTGDFYEHAAECYIMWPLMEMADTRFKYIPNITYVVNCINPIAKLTEDYYLRMACNAQMGKDLPVYSALSEPVPSHGDHLK